jgi:hypothetical protein
VFDTRTRVPLNKAVDLAQLAAEVGAALTASDSEVVAADPTAKVDARALAAAVKCPHHRTRPGAGRAADRRRDHLAPRLVNGS